jgi:EamA domain-containing membrane protein RarD
MNRSGLEGNMSAAMFNVTALLIVAPFALPGSDLTKLAEARWLFVGLSGLLGAVGILAFNGGLAKSTPETVGVFIVLVTILQIATPAINHIVQNGISTTKLVGFVLAGVAAYLLSK